MQDKAKVWEEVVMLPTYKAAAPEKAPLFLERRTYQGSTGKVYPLPVTEKISDVKEDAPYRAVFLENEYLKVMLLPELGGRIHRAYDKTNGYDFVYYNEVVKPALVGLVGPWISGGIEFNWPQHHRPTTFAPVECEYRENADGSVTAFMSEVDKMNGTKGEAAITLYPGKAYIEIKGKLFNPTDLAQSFLWWANPAVPVNDHTYSVFPPDVNAVMDHGKRAVSTFPIATGEYYKYDYSAGVDISRYKNIKVPTSYMAAHSDFNFIGNYDESLEAGLLHVADHHINPGKKQWTWGCGDFGKTWDRALTDENGPYIELMTGIFTDNQPDFTWLKPQEEKNFVQYFMPYKGVGRVGNATKDAAVSLKALAGGKAELRIYATGEYEATVVAKKDGETLLNTAVTLSPKGFSKFLLVAESLKGIEVEVSAAGKTLVSYQHYEPKIQPVPEPASVLKAPGELKSCEELYLAAQHLEQYRHATFEPADYYEEGLRRDPTDIRLNVAYGRLLYRRGRVAEAREHFAAAVKKETWRNPNPYSGEGYFNLALADFALGDYETAYDEFYKATWSAETQAPAFYYLACLKAREGAFEEALGFAKDSLVRGWHNIKARALIAAIMRHMGEDTESFLKESLAIDPIAYGCLYEEAKRTGAMDSFKKTMRPAAFNYLHLSLDYMKAGFCEEAAEILSCAEEKNPLVGYYLGFALLAQDKEKEAKAAFRAGEAADINCAFPSKTEEIKILVSAIDTLDEAPQAHTLLGCLLYDKKQYELAAAHWEEAVKENPNLAVAYRNLSIYSYNHAGRTHEALRLMEKAFSLDGTYPRYLLELDQIMVRAGKTPAERLALIESHPALVAQRDDLKLREVTLLNLAGEYDKALKILAANKFHPWEGGEGKVAAQYKFALRMKARELIAAGQAADAVPLLEATLTYPENLGEGKLPNVPDQETYYELGRAYRAMGESEKAKAAFEEAAKGEVIPEPVRYYNDQPSDYIYYLGLAARELGDEARARKAFHQLIIYGERHRFDKIGFDFFAVSMPEIEVYTDDMQKRSDLYCDYLRALGHLGLGEEEKAQSLLESILKRQNDHQEAAALLN